MASRALDLVTMGHALNKLEQDYLHDSVWTAINPEQFRFLEWWLNNREQISELSSLEALASKDFGALNAFLEEHGFAPKFDPNGPAGIGVVSILDMLVEWVVTAQLATVLAIVPDQGWVDFPAFQIFSDGVKIYQVEGYGSLLVELLTKSGDSLWLMMLDDPGDELDLAMTADHILNQPRELNAFWSGVVVPKVELQIEPDISWMLGFQARMPGDYFEIVQAFQQFKLRMNEHGARAKVASGFGVTRGISSAPQPLRFSRPFIGFFTQAGLRLPIAAFYADYDSWAEPDGTLEEL